MQCRSRYWRSAGWLLLPLGMALLLGAPRLQRAGLVSLRLLAVGGLVAVLSAGLTRRISGLRFQRDDLSGEEAAARRRLEVLGRSLIAVEAAAREVRCECRRAFERDRLEGELCALEGRTRELTAAMARERAVLYTVEFGRWRRRLAPLLRELPWLEADFQAADAPRLEAWVQARLDRVNRLRPEGLRLLARLRADSDASSLQCARVMLVLLRDELAELERGRRHLLVLRAELIACSRPWEAAQPDPELLLRRLKLALGRLRGRRPDLRRRTTSPQ